MTDYQYQVGGSLTTNAPSYVTRQADAQLYEALQRGEFCYVLNSRQMGKSSLLVRTMHRLQADGYRCTTLDMTNIGSENITPLQWYKGVVADLWSGFNLLSQLNLKTWWNEQEDISLLQKLSRFISELLSEIFTHDRLFIFIDEIDSILSLDFPVDDFFALIRFCYNQRAINPDYHRITFAIFGVANPSDLIKDKSRTPFNIGTPIELQGFTLSEAQPLNAGLQLRDGNTEAVLQAILDWTEGQPFLTQKLCKLAIHSCQSQLAQSSSITPGSEREWVQHLVETTVIQKWESQDEPEHLKTIRDRLLHNEQRAGRLLGIYQQILQGIEVATDDSQDQVELLLSGLVVKKNGQLKVKNQIYQQVFNLEWVERKLADLRPYAQALNAWMSSGQTDESRLLRGQALLDAQQWSQGKNLSDRDYRFLAASQDLVQRQISKDLAAEKQARQLERDKANFALQSAQQAHQLLAHAKQRARQNLHWRVGRGPMLVLAAGVTAAIILARFTGLLQGMEWALLDRFFQARPPAPVDNRIVVIGIDEPDITQVGRFPIPDGVLAQAIATLKRHNPRAIGLDVYRDLPVEPGHSELVRLFQTTPNLIGVEKAVGRQIAPPEALKELGQIGLGDQVVDGDGKVRRALLSVRPPNSNLRLNLGLQMALRYLAADGITPQSNPKSPHQMQIGKAALVPFRHNDGGYVRANTGGYQILLNFYGTQAQFQMFSLTDLLANRIDPEQIRDRIVLIGMTAPSANDLFQVPYSSRSFSHPQPMAGVLLHANIASQIVSGALQGRPMLRVWAEPWEWVWILVWSGVGAVCGWQIRSPRYFVSTLILGGVGLVGTAYLAFLQGWWIPVAPPLIGFMVAGLGLTLVATRQLEKIQLQQTVLFLVAMTQEQPVAGQIAIGYLKESENPENQRLIEQQLLGSTSVTEPQKMSKNSGGG
jgi:adenylate cyclase